MSAKSSTKGSSMPRPGLVLSAMAASGQPLFCFGFWSRACAARRRAGPRAAARRGWAGAAGSGGARYLGRVFYVCVQFLLAPSSVTSAVRTGEMRNGPILSARRARRRGGAPTHETRAARGTPRSPRRRGRAATQGAAATGRAQAHQPGDPSAARPSLGGLRAAGRPPQNGLAALRKSRRRANPSAPTSKRKHANRRPTPCVSNTAAPRPQPREKPAAPNTTDKPERRRAPPQLPNKSPRRL